MNFKKIVRVGAVPREGDAFAKIKYNDGRLSISGVIGPMTNGNARGSCGQYIMCFREYDDRGHMALSDITPAPRWDADMIRRFFDAWDAWHLNDMRANCEHQTGAEWDASRKITVEGGILSKPCTVCGYKYGSAWRREDVPADVLEFLRSLPDTDLTPVWV